VPGLPRMRTSGNLEADERSDSEAMSDCVESKVTQLEATPEHRGDGVAVVNPLKEVTEMGAGGRAATPVDGRGEGVVIGYLPNWG
jgi:hypothetical protein